MITGEGHGGTVSVIIDLSGKVVLITGASRGIGAAVARLFADSGADLVLVSRTIDPQQVEQYSNALVLPADVTDPEAMRGVVDAATTRFGGIDILVNNAGASIAAPIEAADESAWAAMLQVNLISIVRLCNLVLPSMRSRGGGRIVNIASNLGAFALPNLGAYSAAKAALMQFTRNAAIEWAQYGILVNALAVGAVNTGGNRDFAAIAKGIPLGRVATPDEIAGAVLFLASPLASFITGQSIFVDGGASIWFPGV
jgi:3-oxoacyl-[acyl-carrier protein] reductase